MLKVLSYSKINEDWFRLTCQTETCPNKITPHSLHPSITALGPSRKHPEHMAPPLDQNSLQIQQPAQVTLI